MTKTVIVVLSAVWMLMVVAFGAFAGETYYIPVDASSVTIQEAFPDSAYFGMPELELRSYAQCNCRVVLRLNLAAFTPPAGGVLDTAEVGMYVVRNVTGASSEREIEGYALTTAYDARYATWRYPWSSPGGDFDSTVKVSALIPGTYQGWVVWNVTELLREKWTDVAYNGIVFKYREENLAAPGAICRFTSGGLKGTSPYIKLIYDFPSGLSDHTVRDRENDTRLVNAPNPFNAATRISFCLERRQHCELSVYNLLGHRLALLYDGTAVPGEHVVYWKAVDHDGRELPAGMYFCRLRTDSEIVVRRLLLLK